MDQPTSYDILHGDEKTTTALLNTSTPTAKRVPDFTVTAGSLFLESFSAFM